MAIIPNFVLIWLWHVLWSLESLLLPRGWRGSRPQCPQCWFWSWFGCQSGSHPKSSASYLCTLSKHFITLIPSCIIREKKSMSPKGLMWGVPMWCPGYRVWKSVVSINAHSRPFQLLSQGWKWGHLHFSPGELTITQGSSRSFYFSELLFLPWENGGEGWAVRKATPAFRGPELQATLHFLSAFLRLWSMTLVFATGTTTC